MKNQLKNISNIENGTGKNWGKTWGERGFRYTSLPPLTETPQAQFIILGGENHYYDFNIISLSVFEPHLFGIGKDCYNDGMYFRGFNGTMGSSGRCSILFQKTGKSSSRYINAKTYLDQSLQKC